MSIVYLGFDTSIDTIVAIKEMKNQFVVETERQQAVEEFRKEARILAHLNHAGLPRVTHFFEHDLVCYLVMDYIEGETLDVAVSRWGGRVPESAMLPWAWEIVQVLDYLHHQMPPIIFRDLKPSNIIVAKDNHLKLIDFGIAKLFDVNAITHTLIKGAGTPGFAPPEQYGSIGRNRTDVRSDIYALGATLYSLLAGELPVEATARFMNDEPLKPLQDVSPELEKLVLKCLALGQEERYQTMQEVIAALHPLVFAGGAQERVDDTLAPRRPHAEVPRPILQATPTTPMPVMVKPPPPVQPIAAPSGELQPVLASAVTEPPIKMDTSRPSGELPASRDEKTGIPLSAAMIARERELTRRGRTPSTRYVPVLLGGGLLLMAIVVASQVHIGPAPLPSPSPTQATATPTPVPVAGRLHITTVPTNATIQVDDSAPVLAGNELNVKAGTHTVRVSSPGYLDQTVPLDVPAGGDVQHLVTLDRIPQLTLRSTPPGCEVTVDGKAMGKTPVPLHLAPGPHEVSLTHAHYKPWKQTQTLKPNDQVILEAALQKAPTPTPTPTPVISAPPPPPPPPLRPLAPPPPPPPRHTAPATPQPPKATPWQ